MRKRLALVVILFIMVSFFISNWGQPVRYIVEDDEVIEWHFYSEEKLI